MESMHSIASLKTDWCSTNPCMCVNDQLPYMSVKEVQLSTDL